MKLITIRNLLLQSASYIIGSFIVDCGDATLNVTKNNNIEIKGIFLTHCHLDHICGLLDVMERFPNAKIYCSAMTHRGLKDDSLNLMYILPEYAFEFNYDENVVELQEGITHFDGMDVEMIVCNGHSTDSQSYVIGNNLFTGDAYIPHAKVFTKWPTSDKVLAMESEKRLLRMAEERNLAIRPGHWQ